MNLLRRKIKKTGFGAEEPPDINWFAIVLLLAAGVLLCLLLYALIGPLLDGGPEYEIVPYGGDDADFTFTPPATSTPGPTQTAAPQTTLTPTPAPAIAINADSAPRLAEIAQLPGISAEVNSVAFSRDGRLIAAGSYDGSVRVWDATTLEPLQQFQNPSNRVNSIAFSPAGDRLVAGGQDTAVRIWTLDSGAETQLSGPTAAVRAVAFSPDGRRIAAGSDDGVLYIWSDTEDPPALERLLSGHTSYVTSVAFSPDGATVAAGGEDDTIRLWNTATGAPRSVLRGHTSTVTSVAFNPGGTRLVSTSADHTVRVWDLLTESEVATLQAHTENINDAAFSADGSLIVSAGSGIEDNTVRFWDAQSGQEVRAPLTMPAPVNAVAFAADGTLLATGGASYLTLWGIHEGAASGAATAPAAPPTSIPAQPTIAPQQGGAVTCTLTVRATEANRRTGPGTDHAVAGTLTEGQTVQVTGWAQDAERYTWWQLSDGTWARGDAFISSAFPSIPEACLQLPPANQTPGAQAATATAPPQAGSATGCTLTVRAAEANRRTGPGTDHAVAGTLTQGQTVQATGWAQDAERYTWWQLSDNTWARGDAFISSAFPSIPEACLQLPPVTGTIATPAGQPVQAGGTSGCTLTVRQAQAETYSGPGTDYSATGTLVTGQSVQATGWARAEDGYTWWQLGTGVWARGDVFLDATNRSLPDACLSLPAVAAP